MFWFSIIFFEEPRFFSFSNKNWNSVSWLFLSLGFKNRNFHGFLLSFCSFSFFHDYFNYFCSYCFVPIPLVIASNHPLVCLSSHPLSDEPISSDQPFISLLLYRNDCCESNKRFQKSCGNLLWILGEDYLQRPEEQHQTLRFRQSNLRIVGKCPCHFPEAPDPDEMHAESLLDLCPV